MSNPGSTRCTPEITAKVCEGIRKHGRADVACQHAGINRTQFYRWRAWARDNLDHEQKHIWVHFLEETNKAQADFKEAGVELIKERSFKGRVVKRYNGKGEHVETIEEPGDWKAMAWLLERMDPGSFNPVSISFRLRETMEAFSQFSGVISEGEARQILTHILLGKDAKLVGDGGGATRSGHERDVLSILEKIRQAPGDNGTDGDDGKRNGNGSAS